MTEKMVNVNLENLMGDGLVGDVCERHPECCRRGSSLQQQAAVDRYSRDGGGEPSQQLRQPYSFITCQPKCHPHSFITCQPKSHPHSFITCQPKSHPYSFTTFQPKSHPHSFITCQSSHPHSFTTC